MAKLSAVSGGYAVLELNQVAFPRDGRIEAQLPLDGTVFSKASGVPAEVGMILKVDKANQVITFADPDNDAAGTVYALNYSTEHMYDERLPELKNFHMYASDGEIAYRNSPYDDFYPRLGYLSIGDRFTTNAIDLTGTFEDLDITTEPVYLTAGDEGYWVACADVAAAVAPVVQIVEKTTCPNGIDPAVKLMVVKA